MAHGTAVIAGSRHRSALTCKRRTGEQLLAAQERSGITEASIK
jgi:hypothetical protein